MEEFGSLKKRIAELETLNAELSDELSEFKDFAENASIPLHWINGSGVIVWVNQAELDLLGYPKEECLNKHISKFHADKHVIEDILRRLVNKETLINYPARLLCKNGGLKYVLINSNVYWRDGEFVHTRCFTKDITEMKLDEIKLKELVVEMQKKIKTPANT
jgi:two-component system sensor histidine kinase VicK